MSDDDVLRRVARRRDDLEAVADRDGPLAPVARDLLEVLDERGEP